MHLLKKFRLIYDLMDSSDRRKLLLILLISMVNGLLSAASIASILPFVGLITEPEILHTNKYIIRFCELTGVTSYGGAVIAFGLMGLGLLIAGNVISACDNWYGEIFGSKMEQQLSTRLLRNYLGIDSLIFERRNSAERAKEILSDVKRVIIRTLFSMLDLISEMIISGFVVLLLLVVNWSVTLIVFGVLLVVHLLINKLISRFLERYGKRHAKLEASLFNHVLEALTLHKEIKLAGVSDYFVNRYFKTSGKMVRNSLKRSLVSDMPAYLLEIVVFSIILSLSIYFTLFSSGDTQPVTIIGMYAVAAYRLVPSLASIFDRIENIWYDTAILEDVSRSLVLMPEVKIQDGEAHRIDRRIILRDICFDFGESSPFRMDRLSLEFPINRFTCIKGRTGCGKSTVLNLLSGLYHPGAGAIIADRYRGGWPIPPPGGKSRIGLVPASVNVIRLSMYENIALGIEPDEIDRERVHEVCRLVELDDVIEGLPRRYETAYGDEGLCFSSGQIQKLGIAPRPLS